MTAPGLVGPGEAAVVVGDAGGAALFGAVAALPSGAILDLEMVPAGVPMVDGAVVKAWAYRSTLAAGGVALGARVPGPTIFLTEGATLHLRVRNSIANGGAHAFAVPGVVDSGPIACGEERTLSFVAPAAGTYLYLDPLNAPVNRVMGLHGALVVLPPATADRTPYSAPTRGVARLFEDLEAAAPGEAHPWDRERNAVWLFATFDPSSHGAAAQSAAALAPAAFRRAYLPRYLTANGVSGLVAARRRSGDGGAPAGGATAGRAAARPHWLVRTLNAGMIVRSAHVHGAHVHELTAPDGSMLQDPCVVDAWTLPPLARKDVLLGLADRRRFAGTMLLRPEPDPDDVLLTPPPPAHDPGGRARPPGAGRGAPRRTLPPTARASGADGE